LRAGFKKFEKKLTRRANHWHLFIIAEILRARAGKPAAGFFNRTAAAFGTHHLPCERIAARRLQASRRPSLWLGMTFPENRCARFRIMPKNPAGARERAGTRRGHGPRSHAASLGGDRVRV
jgi:hypothetical protein